MNYTPESESTHIFSMSETGYSNFSNRFSDFAFRLKEKGRGFYKNTKSLVYFALYIISVVTVILIAQREIYLLSKATSYSTINLKPTDDTFVSKSDPTKNYGNNPKLRVDGEPKFSYLKFNTSTLEGKTIKEARLRLKVNQKSANAAPRVKFVADNLWSENTLTFENRSDPSGDGLGSYYKDNFVFFDVTTLMNSTSGMVSFMIRIADGESVVLSSKESGSSPQLIVSYAIITTPTPTSNVIATPEPTPVPPSTPTTIPTSVPTSKPTASAIPTVIPTSTPTPQPGGLLRAFPGAMGFAANTKGGRGGKVVYVTNLNDSGAGSLRDALTQTGPRTVLFKVSGTISLQNDIQINNPYITLAAQTAPGGGVQIKGGMIKIQTHDVIIRYLKVRMGNPTGGNASDTDSVSLAAQNTEVYNVILDHCSLIWGTDIGGASILTNAHDITFQDSIFGEGLYLSNHSEGTLAEGGHSMSFNVTALNSSGKPTRLTLYRNLITSSDSRNPQFIEAINADFVNNVIYNWGDKAAFGNPYSLNLIKNMYVYGPLSKTNNLWNLRLDADWPTQHNQAVFESGNGTIGFTGTRGGPSSLYASARFSPYSITNEMTSQEAYTYVLANVGANRPLRDVVDTRIVDNVTTRTMRFPNGTVQNRFINATDLIWPVLSGGTAAADSDNDGMPDLWEVQNFGSLIRGSSLTSLSDYDGDGYTDLEEYLNQTDPLR